MIDENSTLEEVCFNVAAALDRHRIEAVLTGGSAATVYAPAAYTSLDADFVLVNSPQRERLQEALAELGFAPSPTVGMFEHPRSKFTIDFPKGPLAVGGDYIREIVILEWENMRLRIITHTDCVRDRLAHFYYWEDYTALKAAVGVSQSHRESVDVSKLRAWTERESGPGSDHRAKFQEFLDRLYSVGGPSSQ